jgi:molybdenum cofactor cytidylyltransferase
MRFGPIPLDKAQGAVLAHSVSTPHQVWRKATVLSADDIAAMRAAGVSEVIAAVLEADDVGENEAARRIAEALAGPTIEARRPATGRVNLHAAEAGLFTVDRAAVDAINAIDPAITLATLPDHAAVEAGRMAATVKIIPFAVPASLVKRAVAIAAGGGVVELHPFRSARVGLVQTMLPALKPSILDKTRRLTEARLGRSRSAVTRELRIGHDDAELGRALADLAEDNDLVIAFGASAVADDSDVIPQAIRLAGGTVERVGMPVDPGNLLVLGRIGEATIIGAPGCARSPKPNGFDWVLDRLLAGVSVGDTEIAAMGVGGLLMEIESRPQPRDPPAKRVPVVDAVLLAAGRGQRMGGPNKLLARFDGRPLVRRVADMLAASAVRETVAVVGHQAERVADALDGSGARVVVNPDFATGLAGSLKAGIAALRHDAAGALVALGDMPGIEAEAVDRLVAAFAEAGGTSIVRATHAGKRGNPVVLPRSLFDAVGLLEGDTGARQIVEASGLGVIDVEIGRAASLDVDTPEAMAQAGGTLVE